MSSRWRLVAADLLAWRELDGEWLLHDSGSARLHLLDGLTAAVLSSLEMHEATPGEIASGLAAELGHPIELGEVGKALANLAAVDLVESVPR